MAVYGKSNVVEIVRMHKTPYWRISESAEKRAAGNHVVTADFEAVDLGLEYSIDMLQMSLSRLTPGRYLLSAFAGILYSKDFPFNATFTKTRCHQNSILIFQDFPDIFRIDFF